MAVAVTRPVRRMRFDQLKIFTGNANPSLAGKICASLGCTPGAASVEPFSDGGNKPRMPISARLIANLIQRAGADRVLTLDLHAAQIQGFFDVPVDHLFAAPVMLEYFDSIGRRDMTVVSPDAGGVERARAFAKHMNAPLAIIVNRRTDVNVSEVMHIIGDVEGRHCLIVDDLIDTAGTLVKGAEALLEAGATSVPACTTHAVLFAPATQ